MSASAECAAHKKSQKKLKNDIFFQRFIANAQDG
jgi:hypothetical protein